MNITFPLFQELLVVLGTIASQNSNQGVSPVVRDNGYGGFSTREPAHFLYPAVDSARAYIPPISPSPMRPMHGCSETGSPGDVLVIEFLIDELPIDDSVDLTLDIGVAVTASSEKPKWSNRRTPKLI